MISTSVIITILVCLTLLGLAYINHLQTSEEKEGIFYIYLEERNHLYKHGTRSFSKRSEAIAEIKKAYENENNKNATFIIIETYR